MQVRAVKAAPPNLGARSSRYSCASLYVDSRSMIASRVCSKLPEAGPGEVGEKGEGAGGKLFACWRNVSRVMGTRPKVSLVGEVTPLWEAWRCCGVLGVLRAAPEEDEEGEVGEAKEVVLERVTMAGGGPLPVSTPLLEREAGGARLDEEVDARSWKVSSGRSCGS